MAARLVTPGLTRVILKSPPDLGFYPRYVATYNEMFLARPQMQGEASIESEEAPTKSHTERLLYGIAVDRRLGGDRGGTSQRHRRPKRNSYDRDPS